MRNLKSLSLLWISHFTWNTERIPVKHIVLKVNLLYVGPKDILFAGVYVCTFQPVKFTGWSSEGVKGVCVKMFCFSERETRLHEPKMCIFVHYLFLYVSYVSVVWKLRGIKWLCTLSVPCERGDREPAQWTGCNNCDKLLLAWTASLFKPTHCSHVNASTSPLKYESEGVHWNL